MLKDRVKQYIIEANKPGEGSLVFSLEKIYAEKHQLVDTPLMEMEDSLRFADAYIERCDKESENMIRNESAEFLSQPLVYLQKRKNEFIYLESKWFDLVQAESVSLEVDDVFGVYDVMLGLKMQKKFSQAIKEFLNSHLKNAETNFDLIFNGQDGLWDLNFALNNVDGFDENMTIGEAYQLIYRFLFQLAETIEGHNM